MKNKKWLTYTLGVLLTLIMLSVVAGAGYRIGMMQNASFARPSFTHNFDGAPQAIKENIQGNGNPHTMQGDFRDNDKIQAFSSDRGFDRRDGGFSFLPPIFGLIRLVVLGALLWLGYKFVKKSGWRLTRMQASPAPTPAPSASESPNGEVGEKKESE